MWQLNADMSDGRFRGPGHRDFLRDPGTGRLHIAYRRWEGQQGDGPYKGVVQPVTYRRDGAIEPIAMR